MNYTKKAKIMQFKFIMIIRRYSSILCTLTPQQGCLRQSTIDTVPVNTSIIITSPSLPSASKHTRMHINSPTNTKQSRIKMNTICTILIIQLMR